jgi:hypothetical protein
MCDGLPYPVARKEGVVANVIIRRCPSDPIIRRRAEEVSARLAQELGVRAQTVDGARGEFSVLVGDVPMIQRDGDSLPSAEEAEAAVQNAALAPKGG